MLAWNGDTGKLSFERVTDTIHHTDKTIVKLTIDDETLITTPEHPFYVESKGWVKAKDLQVGDAIRKADSSTGKVKSIKIEQTTQAMYNLTVKDAHTFYVGEGQWLVHNCADVGGFKSTQTWDTGKNSRLLGRNIKNGDVLGRYKQPGDAAHHIVESKRLESQIARDILDEFRIDINSKANGLWLDSESHYTTYPRAYRQAVEREIVQAASYGRQSVIEALHNIADQIIAGAFP